MSLKEKAMSNTGDNIRYPHFISSKPHGKDMYEGKSQERLTRAIATHIYSTDGSMNRYDIPRIIGLEGAWGAGKSNVIKQLKTTLDDKYYVFKCNRQNKYIWTSGKGMINFSPD